MRKKKEKPWTQRDVVVGFKHLNPQLQEIIKPGGPGFIPTYDQRPYMDTDSFTIRGARNMRLLMDAGGLTTVLFVLHHTYTQRVDLGLIGFANVGLTAAVVNRTILAKEIQRHHVQMASIIRKNGLIIPKAEKYYPKKWINPTTIANTHPIFHVKLNGDMVFHRPTRLEYARMKFQEKFLGRMGLQPWMWRAYLERPEAPAKVREWAKAKVKEWAQRYRPRPVPVPVRVPVRMRSRTGNRSASSLPKSRRKGR